MIIGTPEALLTGALPVGLGEIGAAHTTSLGMAVIPLLALVVLGVFSPRTPTRVASSMGARPLAREALPSDIIRAVHAVERTRGWPLSVVVVPAAQPSACVIGARVLGVTSALLEWRRSQRLSEGEVTALLQHEIGHLQSSSSRCLFVGWTLAWPAAALTDLLVACLPRRLGLPGRQMVVLGCLCTGTLAAISARFDLWWLAAPLGLLGLALALGRAHALREVEFAADQYAVDAGKGPELASALGSILDATPQRPVSVFDTHPPLAARIGRVRAQQDEAGAPPEEVGAQ